MTPTKRRVRVLRNLVINEISSCDVGANPGAKVLLMKRHEPEHHPQRQEADMRSTTTAFEKMLHVPDDELVDHVETGIRAGTIRKSDLSRVLDRRARALARPDETPEVAFTKALASGLQSRDSVGAKVLNLMLGMPGLDHRQQRVADQLSEQAQTRKSAAGDQDAMEFDRLVNALAAEMKCSKSRAIDAALSTEEGRAIFQKSKTADLQKNLALQHGPVN